METKQEGLFESLESTEPQMTATLWAILEKTEQEAPRAKQYLKLTGATMPPDRVKEILHLKTSSATLGRKFRAACAGDNPELIRSYYVNDRGTKIAQYAWNPEHK